MPTMHRPSRIAVAGFVACLLVLAPHLALAGAAAEPAPAAERARVTVTYQHPENFTETRKSRPIVGGQDDDYLNRLKAYLQKRGEKILSRGQSLDVVITDIDRAGDYEPWRGPNYGRVRIIRDIYPPRIDLRFKLMDAEGRILREGSRKLRDPGFITTSSTGPGNTDTLRYEKQLIDRWLAKGAEGL